MEEAQALGVAHTIRAAAAPVFLPGLLTNRLARIVDRARRLEAALVTVTPGRARAMRIALR